MERRKGPPDMPDLSPEMQATIEYTRDSLLLGYACAHLLTSLLQRGECPDETVQLQGRTYRVHAVSPRKVAIEPVDN